MKNILLVFKSISVFLGAMTIVILILLFSRLVVAYITNYFFGFV